PGDQGCYEISVDREGPEEHPRVAVVTPPLALNVPEIGERSNPGSGDDDDVLRSRPLDPSPQHGVHHPAAATVQPVHPAMAKRFCVLTTGVFEGVAEDRQALP